jgi:hypothetical protein
MDFLSKKASFIIVIIYILISSAESRIRTIGCTVNSDYFDTTAYSCYPCESGLNVEASLYFKDTLLINNKFGC